MSASELAEGRTNEGGAVSVSNDTRPAPKWTVSKGEDMPQTVMVQTHVGRCETCGFLALGHTNEYTARREMQRHHQAEHPEEWPKHDDGTPCFHTRSNCTEHGSCMDCDSCKLECECN